MPLMLISSKDAGLTHACLGLLPHVHATRAIMARSRHQSINQCGHASTQKHAWPDQRDRQQAPAPACMVREKQVQGCRGPIIWQEMQGRCQVLHAYPAIRSVHRQCH